MNFYGNTRWQKAFSTIVAGTAASCRSCDSRTANISGRSLSYFWCVTHIDSQLAQGASKSGYAALKAHKRCPKHQFRLAGRYLQHWGFTPQKPLRRAYEQDPQAVQRWLEHDYPAIRRRQARTERAQIHWGDEMGMRRTIRSEAVMTSKDTRPSFQEPVSDKASIRK